MFTYKQTIRKLLLGEHKELFSKLDMQDYELLFTHSKLGLFSQIKEQLEKGDKFYVEIPKLGRFSIKPNKVKIKVNYYNKCVFNEERKLEDSLVLQKDKEKAKLKLEEFKKDLLYWITILVERYDYYVEEKRMNMKNSENKERLYLDPIKRDLVIDLISNRELTLDSFIYNVKRINTPLTKGLFLVALDNINDVLMKRKKTESKKISKSDFLTALKDQNIYVENY